MIFDVKMAKLWFQILASFILLIIWIISFLSNTFYIKAQLIVLAFKTFAVHILNGK